jgi:hypothetical protein
MDIELVAKEMRERALLIEGNQELAAQDLRGLKLKWAKEQQLAKVEAFKKLYFNAGRWAGGARDHIAREAFEQVGSRIEAGQRKMQTPDPHNR